MNGVFQVELKGCRDTLKSTPEQFSSLFDNVVCGEGVQKLFYLVIEYILEDGDC